MFNSPYAGSCMYHSATSHGTLQNIMKSFWWKQYSVSIIVSITGNLIQSIIYLTALGIISTVSLLALEGHETPVTSENMRLLGENKTNKHFLIKGAVLIYEVFVCSPSLTQMLPWCIFSVGNWLHLWRKKYISKRVFLTVVEGRASQNPLGSTWQLSDNWFKWRLSLLVPNGGTDLYCALCEVML